MKTPKEILFAHWKAWADATHSVNATRRDLEETGLPEVVIPAMLEYGQAVVEQAVSVYSEYFHSAEVIRDNGKSYMELRLRWELPCQESPASLVLNIVNETTETP